jgi:hypothetical protein
MQRSLLRSTLLALGVSLVAGLAPACSDDAPTPPAQAQPQADDAGSSSSEVTTPPASTGTTPGQPLPPPAPEWVPPVVATTSAACGVAQGAAVHANFTTPSGRTFHVWGPTNYDPNKTYPVVMVFHGWYANGEAFQSWFEMEQYVQNEAFVVYPDAVGGLWDVNGTKDLLFFDEMVKQLGETYCINPSRVLGFGFSYGGHFVDHLGCKRAGYVKAITVGDGGPGGDRLHCGRLPVLVTTRTHDTDEYPAYGLNVAAGWTSLNQCGAAGDKAYQNNGEDMGYCVTHASCKNPGGLTYCEDTSTFPAGSPPDWNHTVREYYRSFAFKWFQALP